MNVVSFVVYRKNLPWATREHSDAVSLTMALKHQSKRLSKLCLLDTKSRQEALEWFGALAGLTLAIKKLSSPIVLIPIPNSDCVQNRSTIPRTLFLAESVAAHTANAVVCDCLRWKQHQTPSHCGGTRNISRLNSDLLLTITPPLATAILVDDVVTTGAHIIASAAVLARGGVYCNEAICVASRSFSCLNDSVFCVRQAAL
jgi:predicted amidophosphoribosyltransferase